jgi:hypothetical protein
MVSEERARQRSPSARNVKLHQTRFICRNTIKMR